VGRIVVGVGCALAAARAEDARVIPGKRPMLLHNDFPEDLETPSEYFKDWLTPTDMFFVRQHCRVLRKSMPRASV